MASCASSGPHKAHIHLVLNLLSWHITLKNSPSLKTNVQLTLCSSALLVAKYSYTWGHTKTPRRYIYSATEILAQHGKSNFGKEYFCIYLERTLIPQSLSWPGYDICNGTLLPIKWWLSNQVNALNIKIMPLPCQVTGLELIAQSWTHTVQAKACGIHHCLYISNMTPTGHQYISRVKSILHST
jgi:hypothetical protein